MYDLFVRHQVPEGVYKYFFDRYTRPSLSFNHPKNSNPKNRMTQDANHKKMGSKDSFLSYCITFLLHHVILSTSVGGSNTVTMKLVF